jgi:hypothetical protein
MILVRVVLCLLAAISAQDVPPEHAPEFPTEPPRVACPTCKGAGHAVQSCLDCDGEGELGCQRCNPTRTRYVEIDTSQWTGVDADLVARIRETNEIYETQRGIENVLSKTGASLSGILGSPQPGKALCPAKCFKGTVFLRADTPCLYCAGKGLVNCPDCDKKGRQRCTSCKGKGKHERECEDCLGAGQLRDPAAVPSDQRGTCPACAGKGCWPCMECDEQGKRDVSCRPCKGEGWTTCAKCLRSRFIACNKCGASGDLTVYYGPKKSNDCDQCEKKGRIPCTACEKGRTPCERCKRVGHAPQRCSACQGFRLRACQGCTRGGFRSWERAGEMLLRAGNGDAALEYFRLARERVDPCYAALKAKQPDQKELQQRLERQRRADAARLDAQIKAAGRKR